MQSENQAFLIENLNSQTVRRLLIKNSEVKLQLPTSLNTASETFNFQNHLKPIAREQKWFASSPIFDSQAMIASQMQAKQL